MLWRRTEERKGLECWGGDSGVSLCVNWLEKASPRRQHKYLKEEIHAALRGMIFPGVATQGPKAEVSLRIWGHRTVWLGRAMRNEATVREKGGECAHGPEAILPL